MRWAIAVSCTTGSAMERARRREAGKVAEQKQQGQESRSSPTVGAAERDGRGLAARAELCEVRCSPLLERRQTSRNKGRGACPRQRRVEPRSPTLARPCIEATRDGLIRGTEYRYRTWQTRAHSLKLHAVARHELRSGRKRNKRFPFRRLQAQS
jgi:hypothetical protein